MIKLTPIERTAMEEINSEVPYNTVLAECELPPLNVYTQKQHATGKNTISLYFLADMLI